MAGGRLARGLMRELGDSSSSQRLERPGHRVPNGAGRAQAAPPESGVSGLAAVIGNRALSRLVESGALRARLLARYDTGEHTLFGGDDVVFVKGEVKITEREMLTLGDLYERVDDVYQADVDELKTLVGLIRRDRDAY